MGKESLSLALSLPGTIVVNAVPKTETCILLSDLVGRHTHGRERNKLGKKRVTSHLTIRQEAEEQTDTRGRFDMYTLSNISFHFQPGTHRTTKREPFSY